MTNQYSPRGHERFRELAYSHFTWLALVDDAGNQVTRIDVTTDDRVQNVPDPSTNPLTYTVEVSGTDGDIDNPVTIVSTELYETETASTPIGSDPMKDATIEADGDVVTVSHEQEIPPQ